MPSKHPHNPTLDITSHRPFAQVPGPGLLQSSEMSCETWHIRFLRWFTWQIKKISNIIAIFLWRREITLIISITRRGRVWRKINWSVLTAVSTVTNLQRQRERFNLHLHVEDALERQRLSDKKKKSDLGISHRRTHTSSDSVFLCVGLVFVSQTSAHSSSRGSQLYVVLNS